MSVKSISLGTPYRWLGEAAALVRAQPRVLLGAAAMLVLVALVPTLLQLLVEAALKPSSLAGRATVQALFTIVGLLVLPPVVGGYYRLVQAVHEGGPAQASDVFALFHDGSAAIRLIVTNLIFLLISMLLLMVLGFAFSGQELIGFLQAVAALQPGATEFPPLPDGILSLMFVLLLVGAVVMTAQNLAMAQVAIAPSAPMAAAGNGLKAAVRNVGALLLFYLPVALILFFGMLIVGVVGALLGTALALVSPLLALVVIVPLVLALMMLLYALMFTFFHQAWRDTLADGSPPAANGHAIAV